MDSCFQATTDNKNPVGKQAFSALHIPECEPVREFHSNTGASGVLSSGHKKTFQTISQMVCPSIVSSQSRLRRSISIPAVLVPVQMTEKSVRCRQLWMYLPIVSRQSRYKTTVFPLSGDKQIHETQSCWIFCHWCQVSVESERGHSFSQMISRYVE